MVIKYGNKDSVSTLVDLTVAVIIFKKLWWILVVVKGGGGQKPWIKH